MNEQCSLLMAREFLKQEWFAGNPECPPRDCYNTGWLGYCPLTRWRGADACLDCGLFWAEVKVFQARLGERAEVAE